MEKLVKPSNRDIESVFVAVTDDASIDVKDVLKSCRCCLRRPPDVSYLDDTELYFDMLQECFSILLTDNRNSPGICEECVGRLQDATDFKLQVVRCQEKLREWLEANQDSDEEPEIKAEIDGEGQDVMIGDMLCLNDKGPNQEIKIKLEIKDDENENIMLDEVTIKSEECQDAGSDDGMSFLSTDEEEEVCIRGMDLLAASSVKLERLRGDGKSLTNMALRKRKLNSKAVKTNADTGVAWEEPEDELTSATSAKRKRGESWTEEGLKASMMAVQSGKLTIRSACKQFNIPRRTLRNHLEKGNATKRTGRKPIFTESQESDLAATIKRFAEVGVPLTPDFIRKQAYLFCERYDIQNNFNKLKQKAGAGWLKEFLKRNPSISVRKTAMNPTETKLLKNSVVEQHLKAMTNLYKDLNISEHPERLYNMDEKGCHITVQQQEALDEERGHLIELERAENVTICMCVNAIGTAIPPMVLFQGQTPDMEESLPVGTLVIKASEGKMTSDLFVKFIQHLAKYKVPGKCLLVVDRAKCHLSYEALDEADKNDIVLFCHSSDLKNELQPLYKVKKSYNHLWEAVMNTKANTGKKMTKDTFKEIFSNIWPKCATQNNIIEGFKTTGLYPFNPEAIPREILAQSILSETPAAREELIKPEETDDYPDFLAETKGNMSDTSTRKKRGMSWTEEGLRAAVKGVQSGVLTQRSACIKYNIPRRTFRNHLEKGTMTKRTGRKPIFTESQESDLAARIKRFAEIGVTITLEFIRKQADLYCETHDIENKYNNLKQIGADWLKKFLKRHPSISILKQHLHPARTQRSKAIADQHIRTLKRLYNELNITQHPERLHNMDEKGCRVTLHKQQALDEKRGHLIALEHADNMTICMCINAVGTAIPPMILFEGQINRTESEENLPAGTLVRLAPKGMTSDLLVEFIQHLAKYKVPGKCLLVLDGAKCHLSWEALEEADKHDIVLFCLPSNATHKLQPLDKSVDKSYEDLWEAADTNKKTSATFNEIFSNVWSKCMTYSNIVDSFKTTGLFPLNLEQTSGRFISNS